MQTPRARQGSTLGCRKWVWTTPPIIPLSGSLLPLHTVSRNVGSVMVTTRNTVLAPLTASWVSRQAGMFIVVVTLKYISRCPARPKVSPAPIPDKLPGIPIQGTLTILPLVWLFSDIPLRSLVGHPLFYPFIYFSWVVLVP